MKKNKVHNLNGKIKIEHMYGSPQSLDSYDLDKEWLSDVDEMWYVYCNGGYEGSGHCVVRKDTMYAEKNMGHCSCYGPLDDFDGRWYDSLDDLKKVGTDEYSKDLLQIIKYIKNN